MRLVLAGGSGALGRRIADEFSGHGHDVVILTRSPRPSVVHRQVHWDGRTVGAWQDELAGAVLINLAGELVDRPASPANVALLTRSRVDPTRALVAASRNVSTAPALWVQMSTLAIYGDGGAGILDETALPASEPPQMTGVARAWENAVEGARAGRLAVLRTGVVLDRKTPALDRLTKIVRWGLGGRIADGRQWVSWLHIDDFLGALHHVLDDHAMRGVLHVTSPNPVRNGELMATLRELLHRPAVPPTPTWAVRIGARVLRTDPQLALLGRRCVPARLVEAGFTFAYPELRPALADLLQAHPT